MTSTLDRLELEALKRGALVPKKAPALGDPPDESTFKGRLQANILRDGCDHARAALRTDGLKRALWLELNGCEECEPEIPSPPHDLVAELRARSTAALAHGAPP